MADKNLTTFGMNVDISGEPATRLIDHLANGIKWLSMPKGEKADFEEALELYKRNIEADTRIPYPLQSIYIGNARKNLLEAMNRTDIVAGAIPLLEENAKPEEIQDDWFNFFFDRTAYITDDAMKAFCSRLLAGEANEPGSISRQVIHTFSVMDNNLAFAFRYLCERNVRITTKVEADSANKMIGITGSTGGLLVDRTNPWLLQTDHGNILDSFNLLVVTGLIESKDINIIEPTIMDVLKRMHENGENPLERLSLIIEYSDDTYTAFPSSINVDEVSSRVIYGFTLTELGKQMIPYFNIEPNNDFFNYEFVIPILNDCGFAIK